MHRRQLLVLIALTALLVGPMRAASEERAAEPPAWSALQTRLGIRAQGHLGAAALERVRAHPVIGGQAMSGLWSGLRLWASGAGYAVGRRSAGYGLQGGAALPIDGGLELTASYRVTGYSTGEGLDTDVADVDERHGAPFVGLLFQF